MTLGGRERITLFVGMPILFLALLYKLAFAPSLEELHRLRSGVARDKNQLHEIESRVAEHAKLGADIGELRKRIEARGRAFNLFGFMNSTASELKIKDRCEVNMEPQQGKPGVAYRPSAVRVTLQGVSLKELTEFLYRIHAADRPLIVNPIEIRVPGSQKSGLIVTMTVSTLVSA